MLVTEKVIVGLVPFYRVYLWAFLSTLGRHLGSIRRDIASLCGYILTLIDSPSDWGRILGGERGSTGLVSLELRFLSFRRRNPTRPGVPLRLVLSSLGY